MELKNYVFYCPKCRECLTEDKKIVLNTKRSNGDSGVIYLNIAVGQYDFSHIPETEFAKGETVEFHCGSCDSNLTSEQYPNFANLVMQVNEGIEFDLLFSKIAGKRKTYIITEDGIESYSVK